MSGARRSVELRPVPENDKLVSISTPDASGRRKEQQGSTHGPPAAGSGGGASGGLGGHSTGSGALSGAGSGAAAPPARALRTVSTRGLGRASMRLAAAAVQNKVQQGMVDFKRLAANWKQRTVEEKFATAEREYVNEGDQGLVALLARHVDVPGPAWTRLLGQLGVSDGHFWTSGIAAGSEVHRHAPAAGHERDSGAAGAGEAEEGAALQTKERPPRRSVFGLPIIRPHNGLALLWTLAIVLLDVVYTAFWVPMNVAFCTAEYANPASSCTKSDLVGGALYTINVLLSFQIGVVATHGYRKHTVMDGRLVAWLYVRHGRFWLDFVASVPFLYLVVVLAGDLQLDKGWVNCLSLLRLLRMLRLFSITKVVYLDSMSGRVRDSALAQRLSVTVVYSLLLGYQLAVAINLFACAMVMCAYFQGYANSWMVSVSWVDVSTSSPVYQWYAAVYWMIVTATTTGFGDFQPRSIAEMVIANIAMIGGMIMFGVLVASIGNALARATAEAHRAYVSRRKIVHVMEWAELRGLTPELAKQVQNYYADRYTRKQEDALDVAVLDELPSKLRNKVAETLCVPLMADVHILMELSEDLQSLIAENMRPLRLPAGEDLCQQGDVADCFWILVEGTVEAVRYKEGSVTLCSRPGGENPRLLGESVLLGDKVEGCRVRPWTLRTRSPCRLWGIPLGDLFPLLRMYPAIGLVAAEYVKFKVAYTVAEQPTDEHWCELSAVLLKQLQERMPRDEAADIVLHMFHTSAEAETLYPVLEQLLALSTARHGAASVLPPPPGRTSATRGLAVAAASAAAPSGATAVGGLAATVGSGGTPAAAGRGGEGGSEWGLPPAAGAGGSVFGTPAAAAALTSALMGYGSQPLEDHGQGQAGQAGSGPTAQGRAVSGPQVQLPGQEGAAAAVPVAGGSPAPPGSALTCTGCHRCVCPSCGQGLDAPAPGAGHGATWGPGARGMAGLGGGGGGGGGAAGLPAAIQQQQQQGGVVGAGGGFAGVHGRAPGAPAGRSWAQRSGTLRRVSIGMRQDQVWANERRSFERRGLGRVSGMMQGYE